MKKILVGAAILLIGLGFFLVASNCAQAQEITPTASSGLSQQDAVMLKKSLDMLKTILDLLALKIQTTPTPIENASSINVELSKVKNSLVSINSTIIAIGNSNVAANGPVLTENKNESVNIPPVNNRLASASSVFDWKYVIWPAIVVIAVIVLEIVIQRKIAGKKLATIQSNIKEMKEKSA